MFRYVLSTSSIVAVCSCLQFSAIQQHVVKSTGAASLSAAVLMTPLASFASNTAAQISLDTLPPSTVEVAITDLPVVGKLVSGLYTKVDNLDKKASVTIKSPKDKVSAVKKIVTAGHLEFDVSGLIKTHLDVDIAADEPGTATIVVKSPLIPPLPFKNEASSGIRAGGRSSDWKLVTDLGNGESYYYNQKTGVTQFEEPKKPF